MKTAIKISCILFGMLMGQLALSQVKTNHLKNSVEMDTIQIQSENKLDKIQIEQAVCFIDKFFVPENAIQAFTQRMSYNRNFIKNLPGFIKDDVYEQKDGEGNLTIITVAVWKSQEDLNNAKTAVQDEYKRIDFNPDEFRQRLNITMERGLYTFYQEQ